MTDDHILFREDDGVATITLNRPAKMNAITFDMWEQLLDLLFKIEYTPDIRCVVVNASGPNFSAGTDIGDQHTITKLTAPERSALFSKRMESTNRIFTAMERIRQPILCSVRGLAAGGGWGIAVGGDLVICSTTTQFQIATLGLGSVPDVGVPIQLFWNMGLRKAKQYCFLEERLGAAEAREFGLVNWVVEDAELETETQLIARRLASAPQPGVGFAKAALNAATTRTLTEHLKQEAADVGKCVAEPGYLDRINDFIARQAAKATKKGNA